jgi:uncharacterized coiled-coil protein SlyX
MSKSIGSTKQFISFFMGLAVVPSMAFAAPELESRTKAKVSEISAEEVIENLSIDLEEANKEILNLQAGLVALREEGKALDQLRAENLNTFISQQNSLLRSLHNDLSDSKDRIKTGRVEFTLRKFSLAIVALPVAVGALRIKANPSAFQRFKIGLLHGALTYFSIMATAPLLFTEHGDRIMSIPYPFLNPDYSLERIAELEAQIDHTQRNLSILNSMMKVFSIKAPN